MTDYIDKSNYIDKSKTATIKLDSVEDYQLLNNYVLILVDQKRDEIKLGDGKTLIIDTSFEPGAHAINTGIVKGVPEKFIYLEKNSFGGADWDTDIEVKVGDKVWFDYLQGIECNKIEVGEDLYYLMPYHCLYVARRGKDAIPLNGYILCVPIMDTEKALDFEVKKENTTYAIVAYAGSCNKEYRPLNTKEGVLHYYDDPEVTAGKKIIYTLPYNLFLEDPLHRSFDGDNEYRIVQRRFLAGIAE